MLHVAMENWSQEEKANHGGSEAALEPMSKILGLPSQPSADPQLVFTVLMFMEENSIQSVSAEVVKNKVV